MRAESDTLLHLLATGIFHDDGAHDRIWLSAIERLMTARSRIDGNFNEYLDSYRHYPALLALWVAGVAAIAAEREGILAELLTKPTWRPQFNDRTPRCAADALRPIWLLEPTWLNQMPRWGEGARWIYPASHVLRLDARDAVNRVLPDDAAYAEACDRLECLASYVAVDAVREPSRNAPWMGEFVLDDRTDRAGNGVATRIAGEITPDWAMLAAFGNDVARATKAADDTAEFVREHGRRW